MTLAVEELPDLASEIEVPRKKIDEYERLGHTIVRNICTKAELDAYFPHIAGALDKYKKEKLALKDRDTYHKAFIQVGNLWVRDEFVKRFVLARRFAKIAAELMQVDGVRIYHDQALFKEPGGGHTPWHQDQFYWPIESDKCITMWMPFDHAPIEKGSMAFASGLHKQGPLVHLPISDESSKWFSDYMKDNDIPLATYELNPGDATWHSGWAPHKAPGNSTDQMRPVMTIIYVDADGRVGEPLNSFQPKDMEAWFPGLKPGDLINTHLNPCVWHKDPTKITPF